MPMPHIKQLTKVKIRLSNDETFFGDIIDQDDRELILKTKDGFVLRLMRGAVVYIQEES